MSKPELISRFPLGSKREIATSEMLFIVFCGRHSSQGFMLEMSNPLSGSWRWIFRFSDTASGLCRWVMQVSINACINKLYKNISARRQQVCAFHWYMKWTRNSDLAQNVKTHLDAHYLYRQLRENLRRKMSNGKNFRKRQYFLQNIFTFWMNLSKIQFST